MGKFLKENWLWIVVPAVVTAAALFALVALTGEQEDDGDQPFVYPIMDG